MTFRIPFVFCLLVAVFASLLPDGDLSRKQEKAAVRRCNAQVSPIAKAACFEALDQHQD